MYSKFQNSSDVEDFSDDDDKCNDDDHVKGNSQVEFGLNIHCFWNVTSAITCAVLEMSEKKY